MTSQPDTTSLRRKTTRITFVCVAEMERVEGDPSLGAFFFAVARSARWHWTSSVPWQPQGKGKSSFKPTEVICTICGRKRIFYRSVYFDIQVSIFLRFLMTQTFP